MKKAGNQQELDLDELLADEEDDTALLVKNQISIAYHFLITPQSPGGRRAYQYPSD